MRKKGFPLLIGGLAVGVLLGLAVIWGMPSLYKPGTVRPQVGKPAPDFELTGLDGKKVRLSEFKGRPVLLNFWATWCNPCKEEMPLLEGYYKKLSPDLMVLGADNREGIVVVQEYLTKNPVSFPILLDQKGIVADLYEVRGFPTSYFIDKDGVLRAEHIGQLNEALLPRYLATIGLK